jgi:N-acetylglucosaminyl-diphospho-decaprenol L-rhamnosyltransferase
LKHEPQAQSTPQLSVIIVNWNTYEEIRACLKSLLSENSRLTKEIIVVDNASSDGSAEQIPQEFPSVNLVANSDNRGYAEGCNQGILLSKADCILVLNPDTIVNENALERMMEFLWERPRAAVVGCALRLANGKVQKSWYVFPNPFNFFLYHSVLSLLFQRLNSLYYELQALLGLKMRQKRVDWLMGSCLLMRRTAVENIGLFDPEYFMYCEDTDWCRRAAKAGWRAYYVPGAAITHLHKRSSAKRKYFTLVRLFTSLRRFYRKYNSPASQAALKYAVTLDMLVRLALLATMKFVRPSRARDYCEQRTALKEILRIYWRGDAQRENRH